MESGFLFVQARLPDCENRNVINLLFIRNRPVILHQPFFGDTVSVKILFHSIIHIFIIIIRISCGVTFRDPYKHNPAWVSSCYPSVRK